MQMVSWIKVGNDYNNDYNEKDKKKRNNTNKGIRKYLCKENREIKE